MNQNSQEKLPPSDYSVRFVDDLGRIAIVDKSTEKSLESFSPIIDDAFVIQRMQEVREAEIFKQKFFLNTVPTQNRPYGNFGETVKGGLILPDGY
jgi:hypothetical protein